MLKGLYRNWVSNQHVLYGDVCQGPSEDFQVFEAMKELLMTSFKIFFGLWGE